MPHVGPEHVPCACTYPLNIGHGLAIALTGKSHRCDSILGLLDSALQQRGEIALLKAYSKILKDGADKLVSKAQLLGQDNKKKE
jgi:hypothetical protein